MIQITIPAMEIYDEKKEEFIQIKKDITLELEHSLISIRKWEAKHHKPFLDQDGSSSQKSHDELIDYLRCMTVNGKVSDEKLYEVIPLTEIEKVVNYIKDPMTATWFSDRSFVGASVKKGEIITAEVIYYWMITLHIPVEFERWHLGQLLTLIKVINIKNEPAKKMDRKTDLKQRAELNRIRRAKLNSKG